MKRILKTVVLVALMAFAASAAAQITIPGTDVSFRLNNDDWRYLRTF